MEVLAMKVASFIACSMDGFIARSDGDIGWLSDIPNPEGSDYGYSGFMRNIDAIIMGRKTFDTVKTFGAWPYTKPVFILSNSLFKLGPEYDGKASIINGGLRSMLDNLAGHGFSNFYVDGGKTIRGFLSEDLLDEITITTVSILLGHGVPLFGGMLDDERKFSVISVEKLNDSMTQTRYSRDREMV
jgi:dihydrofolate reductase